MVRALDGRERKTVATKPLTEEQRKLAEGAYWLVDYVAGRFSHTPTSLDDRLGWATDGLIDAAGTYNAAEGANFTTWARYRMEKAILHAIREGYGAVVKVGRYADRTVGKDEAARLRNLQSINQRCDRRSGWEANKAIALIDLVRVDGPCGIDREMVRKAARTLGRREAIILSMYFGYDWRMKEIGRRLGLSESRVSQTISECLSRLREDRRIREAMTP